MTSSKTIADFLSICWSLLILKYIVSANSYLLSICIGKVLKKVIKTTAYAQDKRHFFQFKSVFSRVRGTGLARYHVYVQNTDI